MRQTVNDYEVIVYSRCYLLFDDSIRPECAAESRYKPLVQAKPKMPLGCKLVGTVRGIKL